MSKATREAEYCDEIGCLRKVLPPYIYCDKHQDKSSTPTEDTPTVPGASEKHQCICKDCGKQVDTPVERMVKVYVEGKEVGEISLATEYRILIEGMILGAEADISFARDRLKQLDQGTDLAKNNPETTSADTQIRPGEHKKQELERGK